MLMLDVRTKERFDEVVASMRGPKVTSKMVGYMQLRHSAVAENGIVEHYCIVKPDSKEVMFDICRWSLSHRGEPTVEIGCTDGSEYTTMEKIDEFEVCPYCDRPIRVFGGTQWKLD